MSIRAKANESDAIDSRICINGNRAADNNAGSRDGADSRPRCRCAGRCEKVRRREDLRVEVIGRATAAETTAGAEDGAVHEQHGDAVVSTRNSVCGELTERAGRRIE